MGNTLCCSADGGTAPPVDAEGEPLFEHTQDKAMTKARSKARMWCRSSLPWRCAEIKQNSAT